VCVLGEGRGGIQVYGVVSYTDGCTIIFWEAMTGVHFVALPPGAPNLAIRVFWRGYQGICEPLVSGHLPSE